MRRLLLLFVFVALVTTGCGEEPRGLEWEVVFAPGVDRTRAVRVETRILADGCDGTTELYIEDVLPSTPVGRAPGVLSPGRYGFEAVAWDVDCVPYARDCQEYTLPEIDGETVLLTLEEEPGATNVCVASACRAGTCDVMPTDAMADTLDGGDATPPPGPLIVGQGLPSARLETIDLSEDAVIVTGGTAGFTAIGAGGGWIQSSFDIDGLSLGYSVTGGNVPAGTALHVASAALEPVSGALFELRHGRTWGGFSAASERWAWAAISADEVETGGLQGFVSDAQTTLTADGEQTLIVVGRGGGETTGPGSDLTLSLLVDGTPCGRTQNGFSADITSPLVGASFFCLTSVDPGEHAVRAETTASNVASFVTSVDYVAIPRARVPTAGLSTNPAESLVLGGPGVLFAFGWQAFRDSDMGTADAILRVDTNLCAHASATNGPSDLAVSCIWPVSGTATVSLSLETRLEDGTTPRAEPRLGWAFLSAEPP